MWDKRLRFLIPAIVSLTSFWFWRMLHFSPIISICAFLLSIFIFIASKKSKILLGLVAIFFFVLTFLLLRTGFDKTIFTLNFVEQSNLDIRSESFAKGFGKLYENRIGVFLYEKIGPPFYKIERNFFDNLDPNIYFDSGHPRERSYALEFAKFSLFFVPFFAAGLYIIFRRFILGELLYLTITAFISSFLSPMNILGQVLFFPVFVYVISLGIEGAILWLKNT